MIKKKSAPNASKNNHLESVGCAYRIFVRSVTMMQKNYFF